MPTRLFSYSLVAIQFAVLAALALTAPWRASGLWLILEVAAILLGGWAIVAMRLGNFNFTPNPKQSGELVQRGPYRWIRHPMYLSLILLTAALVATYFSWLRLLLWLILTVNLLVKLNYEEQLLRRHFANYEQFCQQTWRLIPFFY